MSINAPKIKDYHKKIDIWEKPPFYSSKSKLDDMNIDYEANRFDVTVQYAREIVGKEFKDIEKLCDTFTYHYEIKSGYEKEKYEDIPFIIPYIVEGSKELVIVLSGGGFAYKTNHGGTNGGKDCADWLNKNGISAVLLDYRVNPYKFPTAMIDLQRAIRYIRYNYNKFSINPDNISILGYSAGGYIVASFINKYIGKDVFPKKYVKDEIDNISDSIKSAAFIYSPFSFNYNVPMLVAVEKSQDIIDEEKRKIILEELDLSKHINSKEIPQFVSYSNGDKTVNVKDVERYISAAKENGVNISRYFLPDKDHGYNEKYFMDDFISWLNWI